jgi:bis(5'-nucleosyl)-tetraphosphatase (symmetrical)
MAIYAIGDIQGCFDELQLLLEKIKFNEKHDQLWFVGDLVNRGAKSLETLRFIKNLGECAITVLGNHDVHLLVAAHFPERVKHKDTIQAILAAPDCAELLNWLRNRPLFHYDENLKIGLLHAGLPPQWDLAQTQKMARLGEAALQANDKNFLAQLYGDLPNLWTEELTGIEQLRFIFNCFTRMRFCTENGQLDFIYNGNLGSQPSNLQPWFSVPHRKTANLKFIFGHWAALGFHQENNCFGIDTGCVWGNELTALRLDSGKFERFSVSALR